MLASDVAIRIDLTDLAGNPVAQVPVGADFQLNAYVRDLRSEPKGVFAAYLDVAHQATEDDVFSLVYSELQRLILPHDTRGGSFQVEFDNESASVAIGGSFSELQSNLTEALESLPTIGSGNIEVVQKTLTDNPSVGINNQFAFDVRFIQSLAETDVPPISLDGSQLVTVSGNKPVSVEEIAKGVRENLEAFRYAFRPSEHYPNGHSGEDGDFDPETRELLDPNVFSEIGFFDGTGFRRGTEGQERLLWSVTLNADALGSATFSPNPADEPVDSLVLFFDTTDPVAHEDIDYGEPATIEVVTALLDFGDAPSPYRTTLDVDGARHVLASSLPVLGSSQPDSEDDGQPADAADGDDSALRDDEDGITGIDRIIVSSSQQPVTVEISGTGTTRLNGWVDFNQDGDWLDAGEQVFEDLELSAGQHALSFDVPQNAELGTSFARFRVNSAGGVNATGVATDGEVEDYRVELISWTNSRDRLDVNADGGVSPVDVLVGINRLNDIPDSKLPAAPQTPPPFYDVNNDGFVTPADSLLVINYLNRAPGGEGESPTLAPAAFGFPTRSERAHQEHDIAVRKLFANEGSFLPRVAATAETELPAMVGQVHTRPRRDSRARSDNDDRQALDDALDAWFASEWS